MSKPLVMLSALCVFAVSACAPAPDCKLQAGQKPHQAANAGCAIRHGRQLLVVVQRGSNRLNVPGGGQRANESAQCTAHRETWEETGIDVSVAQLLHVFDNGFHLYDCRTASPDFDPEKLPSPPWHSWSEVTAVRWVNPTQTPTGEWRYPQKLPALLQVLDESGE